MQCMGFISYVTKKESSVNYKAITISCCLLSFIMICSAVYGCTEFRVTSKDKTVVIGRSMEWGEDMHSRVVVQPRGQNRISKAPNGKDGLHWQSKYGMVYVDAYGLDIATDGMNEKGLSVGLLLFPGCGKFQTIPGGKNGMALSHMALVFWLLGNFETVEQVRDALSKVYVWAEPVDIPMRKNFVWPTHYGIYDATGKGIVVEYTKDGLKIFDNEIGVLTNSPTYDWHLTNLRNYVGLTSIQVKPVQMGELSLAPIGQGTGLHGIPGDFTPPSRFVRASAMVYFADPASNTQEAIVLTNHILNTVDIPLGTIKDIIHDVAHKDYSQWVVLKDLTNKDFYFRTYKNLTLAKIDLKKLDFSPHAKSYTLSMEEGAAPFIDISDKFLTIKKSN